MIKKTTKYQTPDGKLFDTEAEAQQHIDHETNSKTLYSFIENMQGELHYTTIDDCEFHDWLVNNAKAVREVLKVWDK